MAYNNVLFWHAPERIDEKRMHQSRQSVLMPILQLSTFQILDAFVNLLLVGQGRKRQFPAKK
jgi:hypothetical protein